VHTPYPEGSQQAYVSTNVDVGDVVSKVFRIYTRHAGVLLSVAALVFLIDALVRLLAIDRPLVAALAGIVTLILSTMYTGMVVELVSDVRDGRLDQTVGTMLRSVGPVILPLIAVSILAGIAITIGFVLLIVPGLYLVTIWAVLAPVVVLERSGVFAAFGRSRRLVKGDGWQVFGVIVLFFVIYICIGIVLTVLGALFGDAGQVVFGYIGSVITAPLVALAASVLYFELKERREGVAAPAAAGGIAPETPGGFPPPSPQP
jgi:hypothetical protein